ncbi:MAG: hypothetical protein ABL880_10620 [Methylotenera sp.]
MKLSDIGQRLSRLKAESLAEAGLLTYPIGALFCASEAQRCKFANRIDHPDRWRVELNEALIAAGELAHEKRPSESTWLSVVHFNSALHRIDAGFERVIKHITGSRSSKIDVLEPLALQARVPPTTIALWRNVRKHEVNRLKHHIGGALSGQRISYQEMLKSLDALVRLLETRL